MTDTTPDTAADTTADPQPAAGFPYPPETGPFSAKAGSYYRNVRYVIAAALVLGGLWFLYDGFVAYPEEHANHMRVLGELEDAQARNDQGLVVTKTEELKKYDKHPFYSSILPQRIIGFVLPPLGLFLLWYWLKKSRGEYMLDRADVLHAPGHPDVPASAVTGIDDDRWAKKGISVVRYDHNGEAGEITLDDFVYEAEPVHRIHDRLVHVTGHGKYDPDSKFTPTLPAS